MRSKKFTLLALFIMVFIFSQSALPANLSSQESGRIVNWIMGILDGFCPVNRETLVFVVRKGAHFTEYLILGCALLPAVKEWMSAQDGADICAESSRRVVFLAWIIGTLYAVTDELHQAFVPGRSCELRDMAIDSCGVLVGVLIATLVSRLNRRR